MQINITHLYPEEMNLYGDLGNVICLKMRAEKRGIEVKINNIGISDKLVAGNTDIYFFGGGQDADQLKVYPDLLTKKDELLQDLDKGIPMLAICGGYQLLGDYFLDGNGNKLQGLGFLPIETVAPDTTMKTRAVGDLVTELVDSEIRNHYSNLKTLVGFENHSGRTKFNSENEVTPLGKVLHGYGDNYDKISDGIIYKNTIGSYMHGSLLPKNPHLADYILRKALEMKYKTFEFPNLDDSEEIPAHKFILQRYKINN